MSEGSGLIWIADVADIEDSKTSEAGKLKDAVAKAKDLRESDEFIKKSRAVTESINKEAAGTWNRVMEVIEFAKRMGYQKLGIACCTGLAAEGKTLAEILHGHGFEVRGVQCSMDGPCNSPGQALLLNEMGTELNIMMGFCVGHDAAFIKLSDAPVTPLAVKDKVTCHNPVVALYCNYQKKRLVKE